jgi:uncharacterized protein YndB with AHSA1/START domain
MNEKPSFTEHSILVNATPINVWKVLTDPEQISCWITEQKTKIISEWKEGSAITFESEWHGKKIRDKGWIQKLEPGKIFRYSYWTKIFRLPDLPENYAIIEFRLENDNGRTILSVTHSNLVMEAGYEHSDYYWKVALHEIKKLAESA